MHAVEPPIGFMRLWDSVYVVGSRLHGPDWRAVGKIPKDPHDRRLFEPESEQVIKKIAEWCEGGDLAAGYRSITGDVESVDRNMWRRPQWQLYFSHGVIDLDLPLVNDTLQPTVDGHTVSCRREIFVSHRDIDRLIKTVSAPQKSKAGSKEKYPWSAYKALYFELKAVKGHFNEEDQTPDWNSKNGSRRNTPRGHKET